MLLNIGTQERVIAEVTPGAGTTTYEGSTRTDSILVSLFVNSLPTGTLDVTIYTLTDTGKEDAIIAFPQISASTTNLLLRQASVTLQRFRVVATYSDVVDYEIYIRAISGAGQISVKTLGAPSWRTDQTTIGTTPSVLIASSLTDRNGIIIKNWSSTANVYVASSSADLLAGKGYPLAPRDNVTLDVSAGAQVYAVSDQAGTDVRLGEIGG